jgi:hypothetical protein
MNSVTHTPDLCKVFFDRSAGEYIVRNGREIARFPQGSENKVKAQWTAVEHDAPDVARVARKMLADGLADEGRLVRAARIVIEGKITEHYQDCGYTQAEVLASDGNRSPVTGWPHYQVYHNLTWVCDCQDYCNHQAAGSQHKCKHVLAVMIHQAIEAERREFEAAAARKQADRIERRRRALPAQRSDTIEDMLGYDDHEARIKRAYAAALQPETGRTIQTNFNGRGW